jgi:hypothetical protein
MHFSITSIISSVVLAASTAQACVNFEPVTSYSNGQMNGHIIDNGGNICTIDTIPGFHGDDPYWPAKCVSGYSSTITQKGAEVAYCNPYTCYTFAASCSYDVDAIRCNANVFGC